MIDNIPAALPEDATPSLMADPRVIELEQRNYLMSWLSDPRTAEYFGGTFKLKAAVLIAVFAGGNLSEVARRHDVVRQSAHEHAVAARRIFNLPSSST